VFNAALGNSDAEDEETNGLWMTPAVHDTSWNIMQQLTIRAIYEYSPNYINTDFLVTSRKRVRNFPYKNHYIDYFTQCNVKTRHI